MQLTGIIIAVLDTQSGVSQSGKNWMRQEFVVETQEQYPKKCCFRLFGEDKIKAAALAQNMRVTVDFDIDAREYNGRWYNDVSAWKVTNLDAPQQAAQPQAQAYQPPYQPQPAAQPQAQGAYPPPPANNADDDGLPF